MDEEHVWDRLAAGVELTGTTEEGLHEAGFTTVQWIMMISFGMILLLMIANLVAFQYGGGAIRAAVDEGARWGAALEREAQDCEMRAREILRGRNGLLGGSMGDTIDVSCAEVSGEMVATATGQFEWWFGGVPNVDIEIVGRSVVEPEVVSTVVGP